MQYLVELVDRNGTVYTYQVDAADLFSASRSAYDQAQAQGNGYLRQNGAAEQTIYPAGSEGFRRNQHRVGKLPVVRTVHPSPPAPLFVEMDYTREEPRHD